MLGCAKNSLWSALVVILLLFVFTRGSTTFQLCVLLLNLHFFTLITLNLNLIFYYSTFEFNYFTIPSKKFGCSSQGAVGWGCTGIKRKGVLKLRRLRFPLSLRGGFFAYQMILFQSLKGLFQLLVEALTIPPDCKHVKFVFKKFFSQLP